MNIDKKLLADILECLADCATTIDGEWGSCRELEELLELPEEQSLVCVILYKKLRELLENDNNN